MGLSRSSTLSTRSAKPLPRMPRWLRLDRARTNRPSPPQQGAGSHLEVVVGAHAETTVDQAASACSQLRSLRSTAGRALIKQWKGVSVDLGVDRTWLAELVRQLRQQVDVHEVESLSYGAVTVDDARAGGSHQRWPRRSSRASNSSMPKPLEVDDNEDLDGDAR